MLFVVTETINEELNHPRYWSEPSKYKSQGTFNPLSLSSLWLELNQTKHP